MKTSKLLSYCEDNSNDSDFEDFPPLKVSKKKSTKKRKDSSEDTDPSFINTNEFDIELPKKKSKKNSLQAAQTNKANEKSNKINRKELKNNLKENTTILSSMLKSNSDIKTENLNYKSESYNDNSLVNSDKFTENVEILSDVPLIKTSMTEKSYNNNKENSLISPLIKKPNTESKNVEVSINYSSTVKNSYNTVNSLSSPLIKLPNAKKDSEINHSKHITRNLRLGLSRKQRISKPLHSK